MSRLGLDNRYGNRLRSFLLAASFLGLAACGGVTDGGPGGGGNGDGELPDEPFIADVQSPNFVLAVELESGDTVEGVEERYGGDVIVWESDDYALLGLESEPVKGDLAFELIWERNSKEFVAGGTIAFSGSSTVWAGGASTVWAGGASTVWAGGASTVWAGGEYQWVPENDPVWAQIELEPAHTIAPNLGNGVTVAVIDTGLDLEHPALKQALSPSGQWWDFVDNDALPQDIGDFGEGGYGHGTNVAGIVRQIAPRAVILPIRVLGSDGQGNVADLAAAIDWAVTMGADVINLSLGADKRLRTVDKALKRAAGEGVFITSSAGNDNIEELSYPARESDQGRPEQREHMISVSSVSSGDAKSEFANFGKKLELSAPGENVYGPAPTQGGEPMLASWSGTSMAAPMAAGAIALALGEPISVDRQHLAEYLKTSSLDIYGIEENTKYKHEELGEGRLDVHQFLLDVLGGGDR
ncbi:MAG: S8 family serine peptidase [Trueperaceae bacterium]